jgi:hypothetical protein
LGPGLIFPAPAACEACCESPAASWRSADRPPRRRSSPWRAGLHASRPNLTVAYRTLLIRALSSAYVIRCMVPSGSAIRAALSRRLSKHRSARPGNRIDLANFGDSWRLQSCRRKCLATHTRDLQAAHFRWFRSSSSQALLGRVKRSAWPLRHGRASFQLAMDLFELPLRSLPVRESVRRASEEKCLQPVYAGDAPPGPDSVSVRSSNANFATECSKDFTRSTRLRDPKSC